MKGIKSPFLSKNAKDGAGSKSHVEQLQSVVDRHEKEMETHMSLIGFPLHGIWKEVVTHATSGTTMAPSVPAIARRGEWSIWWGSLIVTGILEMTEISIQAESQLDWIQPAQILIVFHHISTWTIKWAIHLWREQWRSPLASSWMNIQTSPGSCTDVWPPLCITRMLWLTKRWEFLATISTMLSFFKSLTFWGILRADYNQTICPDCRSCRNSTSCWDK